MITVENLHKGFGSLEVLTGIDLEVKQGQSVVVIGQSGCGKSVLLKLIIALLRPDKGNVMVDGQNVYELNQRELTDLRKRIGVLFQFGALFDSMTVAENVGFCLKESLRMKAKEVEGIVSEKLSLVGLEDIGDKVPSEISGGMKKRVALARAIATEPDIILYDEPTTGLDPITAELINELIVNVHKKMGVTSIAVTHDLSSAYRIADRIIMLYKGKIIWDGTPEEIKNTDHPVVKQFINGLSKGPVTEN